MEFEDWKTLYEEDPETFEAKRIDALQDYIDSVEDKGRKALEQTLFRIEMTRRKAKSPLQAAMESSRLMWESFEKLNDALQEFEQRTAALHAKQLNQSNTLRLVTPESEAKKANLTNSFSEDAINLHHKARKDLAKVIQFQRKG